MKSRMSYWKDLHQKYSQNGYGDKPSIFAKEFVEFLKQQNITSGKILELGAGLGQDGKYFEELGFDVVKTDLKPSESVRFLDMTRFPWNFADDSFDVVYAHLSLHYFDDTTTRQIFNEIYRVLNKTGFLAFLVNSKSDPQYNPVNENENGLLVIDNQQKRFFDLDLARHFTDDFSEIICDTNGETYKDSAIGVHNLVRFIGQRIAKKGVSK